MAKKNFKSINVISMPDTQSVVEFENADQIELENDERILLISDNDSFLRDVTDNKKSWNGKPLTINNIVNTNPLQIEASDVFEFRDNKDMNGQLVRFYKDSEYVDLLLKSAQDILTHIRYATLVSNGEFHYILGGEVVNDNGDPIESDYSNRVLRSIDGQIWEVATEASGDFLRRINSCGYMHTNDIGQTFLYFFGGMFKTDITDNQEMWRASVDGVTGALTWDSSPIITDSRLAYAGMRVAVKDALGAEAVVIAGGVDFAGTTYNNDVLYVDEADLTTSNDFGGANPFVTQLVDLTEYGVPAEEGIAYGALQYLSTRDSFYYHGGVGYHGSSNLTIPLFIDLQETNNNEIIKKIRREVFTHNQTTPSTTWTFTLSNDEIDGHSFIEIYDDNYERIIPLNVTKTGNDVEISFTNAESGIAILNGSSILDNGKIVKSSTDTIVLSHGTITDINDWEFKIFESVAILGSDVCHFVPIIPKNINQNAGNFTFEFTGNGERILYARSFDRLTLGQNISRINQTSYTGTPLGINTLLFSNKVMYNISNFDNYSGTNYYMNIISPKTFSINALGYATIDFNKNEPNINNSFTHGFQSGINFVHSWEARYSFAFLDITTLDKFIIGGVGDSGNITNPNKIFSSYDGIEYINENNTQLPDSLPDTYDAKISYFNAHEESNNIYIFINKYEYVSSTGGNLWTQLNQGYFIPLLTFYSESWKTLEIGDSFNAYSRNTEVIYDSGLTGDFRSGNPKPTEFIDTGYHHILLPGYQHPNINSLTDEIIIDISSNFRRHEDTSNPNNELISLEANRLFNGAHTWSAENSATLTVVSEQLKVENSPSVILGYAELEITVISGNEYRLIADFDKDSSADRALITAMDGDGVTTLDSTSNDSDPTGTIFIDFTAISNTVKLRLFGGRNVSDYCLWDNVSVKLVSLPFNIIKDELSGQKLLVRYAGDTSTIIEKTIRNNEQLESNQLKLYLDRDNELDSISDSDWVQIVLNRQERHYYLTSLTQNEENASLVTFHDNVLIGDIFDYSHYYKNNYVRYMPIELRNEDNKAICNVLQSEMNRLRVQSKDVEYNNPYKIDSASLVNLIYQHDFEFGEIDHKTLRQLAISGISDITKYNGTKKGIDNFLKRIAGTEISTIIDPVDASFYSVSGDVLKIDLSNLVLSQFGWDSTNNTIYYYDNKITMNVIDTDITTQIGKAINAYIVVLNRAYVSRPYRIIENKIISSQEVLQIEDKFLNEISRLSDSDVSKILIFTQENLYKFNYIVKNIEKIKPFYVTNYFYL